ncbi:MAG TPA: NAD(P)-dependent oxidoreductase [Chthonomonadaceae bacterium]|nr:NAD(P)-dependent oxidoreductase [Chthonomonadaceae bacterium]
MHSKRNILLTGAAGHIGTAYRKHAGKQYAFRLVDIKPIGDPEGHETQIADLADPDAARRACEGMDTVIHLAADPRTTAEFYKDLLDPNFKATYNMYRAAKDAGCARLIFASSVNAVGGYPHERQVRATDAPCPGNVYGASKAFGESLGAYFGHAEGLSSICIRIGAVGELSHLRADTPDYVRSIFITFRDLCHLLDRCVETPNIPFAVVHGVSKNRVNWLDLTETSRLLDYHPVDDAFPSV